MCARCTQVTCPDKGFPLRGSSREAGDEVACDSSRSVTKSNGSAEPTPHPALRATFSSRRRLFSYPHPSRGYEGDIRSAGKFPRPVWERMKGAVSWASLNPITPEPPPPPKFPFAPAVPKPGNLGNFPERRVAGFLHTFSGKSMTRSSSARVEGYRR